jgi:hypothetical protein
MAGVTPRALFDQPSIEGSHDLDCLRGLGYDFLRELGDRFVTTTPRVRVDLIHQHDFDHRRFWRLMTVRLDDQPVMVVQNGGREGSDFSRRLIVDHENFTLLLAHLNWRGMGPTAAAAVAEEARGEVVPLDDDLPALTNFAGYTWANGELKEVDA